ncbi:Putative aminoacrylate hydrolase RutD [Caballeronia calidae]|uniref:Aminoacrylate hydrolase RutD n=1 Tax=Caballeronia calidae TaxID=1777139 RepID=A0A158AH94_9BURK|nr:alpha/beta hydrolase [Caballeronia calidae]SAK57089.1 Putative aminoacrylate hydrolase RutD [Caballeronia calidae]
MSQWILLRGLTREARHWDAFEAALAAHGLVGADEHAVCIDLPGNGAEHAYASPRSVLAMMDFVRARAAALNVRLPCRVLAMSLGAMVATAWAQHHADDIERLVLINTSMRPFARMHERLRPAAWPMLARIAMNWPQPERCETLIYRLTCNRADTRDADITQWTGLRRTHGASASNALRQLAAAARFRASCDAPRCPVLLLSSAADRLVDPVCSVRIASRWRASHAVHPWAGHDLPHDDAQWTCRSIAAWLDEARENESACDNHVTTNSHLTGT